MGTIYLGRHARASFGAVDYDQLSELGLTQARMLGQALRARSPPTSTTIMECSPCSTLATPIRRRWLPTSRRKSEGALVFTSGGPVAAACASLLNLRPEDALRLNSKLANAAVTKLVLRTGRHSPE